MCIRDRSWTAVDEKRSGVWLGLAVAIKPPLMLMALLLPRRIAGWAGLTAVLVTAAVIAITGIEVWREWLSVAQAVQWIGWEMNLSLWGVAARATGAYRETSMTDISPIWSGIAVALGVAMAFQARRIEGPRRWVLALLWSLILSPAGWSYYLPVGLGPALADFPRSKWAICGVLLTGTSLFVAAAFMPLINQWAANAAALGGFCLWVGFSRREGESAISRFPLAQNTRPYSR